MYRILLFVGLLSLCPGCKQTPPPPKPTSPPPLAPAAQPLQEAADHPLVAAADELEGDGAAEAPVPRLVDSSQAAFAELLDELIALPVLSRKPADC